MTADALYDNLRGFLSMTTRLIEREGKDINVGEDFVVRVTVANTAYAANRVAQPTIVFRRVRLFVSGTEFSTPERSGWHNVADELWPGESGSVDLRFRAISEISNWLADLFDDEEYAKFWVNAQLDQDRYFSVWNYREPEIDIHST